MSALEDSTNVNLVRNERQRLSHNHTNYGLNDYLEKVKPQNETTSLFNVYFHSLEHHSSLDDRRGGIKTKAVVPPVFRHPVCKTSRLRAER